MKLLHSLLHCLLLGPLLVTAQDSDNDACQVGNECLAAATNATTCDPTCTSQAVVQAVADFGTVDSLQDSFNLQCAIHQAMSCCCTECTVSLLRYPNECLPATQPAFDSAQFFCGEPVCESTVEEATDVPTAEPTTAPADGREQVDVDLDEECPDVQTCLFTASSDDCDTTCVAASQSRASAILALDSSVDLDTNAGQAVAACVTAQVAACCCPICGDDIFDFAICQAAASTGVVIADDCDIPSVTACVAILDVAATIAPTAAETMMETTVAPTTAQTTMAPTAVATTASPSTLAPSTPGPTSAPSTPFPTSVPTVSPGPTLTVSAEPTGCPEYDTCVRNNRRQGNCDDRCVRDADDDAEDMFRRDELQANPDLAVCRATDLRVCCCPACRDEIIAHDVCEQSVDALMCEAAPANDAECAVLLSGTQVPTASPVKNIAACEPFEPCLTFNTLNNCDAECVQTAPETAQEQLPDEAADSAAVACLTVQIMACCCPTCSTEITTYSSCTDETGILTQGDEACIMLSPDCAATLGNTEGGGEAVLSSPQEACPDELGAITDCVESTCPEVPLDTSALANMPTLAPAMDMETSTNSVMTMCDVLTSTVTVCPGCAVEVVTLHDCYDENAILSESCDFLSNAGEGFMPPDLGTNMTTPPAAPVVVNMTNTTNVTEPNVTTAVDDDDEPESDTSATAVTVRTGTLLGMLGMMLL